MDVSLGLTGHNKYMSQHGSELLWGYGPGGPELPFFCIGAMNGEALLRKAGLNQHKYVYPAYREMRSMFCSMTAQSGNF